MTSEYFDSSANHLTPGTRARSADINQTFDAIDTGLVKLPTEAQLKRGTVNYAADTGAANALVVTLPSTPTAYADGMEVIVKAAADNTGAATINVNAIGIQHIRRQDGTALKAGDIVTNQIVSMRYNSTTGLFNIIGSLMAEAGTLVEQNADAVAITGGTMSEVAISGGSADDVDLTNGTLDGRGFAEFVAGLVATGYTLISANTNAVSFGKYLCDTSAGVFTLTLPAAPSVGDPIWIMDAKRTFVENNLTIGRNGLNIEETAADLVVDEVAKFVLVYQGAAFGWRIG